MKNKTNYWSKVNHTFENILLMYVYFPNKTLNLEK